MEWVERPPAPARRGRTKAVQGRTYHDEVALLKQHPRRWALLETREDRIKAGNMAQQIRDGSLSSFRDGKFDAVSRQNKVYVRYLSDETW